MGLVLAGFHWEICLAYLDDVVVFCCTWKERSSEHPWTPPPCLQAWVFPEVAAPRIVYKRKEVHSGGQLARWLEQSQEFEFQTEHRNNIAMLMLPHGYKHLLLTALKFRPWNILGLCHGPLKCCNRLRLQILHLVLFWLGWSKKSIDSPWQWSQEKTQQCVPCGLCGTARLEVINGLLYRWWEEASTGTWN